MPLLAPMSAVADSLGAQVYLCGLHSKREAELATLPYVLKLADRGLTALDDDPGFALGLNTLEGKITCEAVAEALAPSGV